MEREKDNERDGRERGREREIEIAQREEVVSLPELVPGAFFYRSLIFL